MDVTDYSPVRLECDRLDPAEALARARAFGYPADDAVVPDVRRKPLGDIVVDY